MSADREKMSATAGRIRFLSWGVFLALVASAFYFKDYVPPSIVFFVGIVMIVHYYNRFTAPPEDVADPRGGIAVLSGLLILLAAYFVMDGFRRSEFLYQLELVCRDVPDGDQRHELCEEMNSQIRSYRENPTDDFDL
jgi:hypothetical protein